MQVAELLALTEWIREEITGAEIPAHYERLHAKLEQNAQMSQPQQPFEAEKDGLIDALAVVPLQELTTEQLRFLDCIGIGAHVGRVGARSIEEVLVRNPLDLATVAARLQEKMQSIEEGVERSDRLADDLRDCVTVDEALGEDVLVRVKFAGEASIDDVVDLKKWTSTWHEIVRGVAMAHDQSPTDVRVIGAGRGSLLIDLATPETIALSLTGIVYWALKVAEKVVEIRKKAQEVKSLQLGNKKIASELEAEARREEKGGAEKITAEFTVKLGLDTGAKGDAVVALGKAINDLVRFLRSGGEVDCVLPEPPEEEEPADESAARQELAKNLQQIRELERRIRQLGPGIEKPPPE